MLLTLPTDTLLETLKYLNTCDRLVLRNTSSSLTLIIGKVELIPDDIRLNVSMCQWLETNKFLSYELIVSVVLSQGNLEILKWLRSQNPPCPWSKWTCTYATMNGHSDLLEWLKTESRSNDIDN